MLGFENAIIKMGGKYIVDNQEFDLVYQLAKYIVDVKFDRYLVYGMEFEEISELMDEIKILRGEKWGT